MAMLAQHPELYARLREEVLDTIGVDGKINPDSVKEMKYLRAVLNGKQDLPAFITATRLTIN